MFGKSFFPIDCVPISFTPIEKKSLFDGAANEIWNRKWSNIQQAYCVTYTRFTKRKKIVCGILYGDTFFYHASMYAGGLSLSLSLRVCAPSFNLLQRWKFIRICFNNVSSYWFMCVWRTYWSTHIFSVKLCNIQQTNLVVPEKTNQQQQMFAIVLQFFALFWSRWMESFQLSLFGRANSQVHSTRIHQNEL